jgi:hypothetical protein
LPTTLEGQSRDHTSITTKTQIACSLSPIVRRAAAEGFNQKARLKSKPFRTITILGRGQAYPHSLEFWAAQILLGEAFDVLEDPPVNLVKDQVRP